MKLCFICSCPYGGFASFMKNTVPLLAKQGHSINIISLNSDYKINFKSNVQKKRIDIIADNKHIKGLYSFNIINLSYFILKMINKIFPKIVKKNRVDLFCYQRHSYFLIKNITAKYNLINYDCVISSEEVLCNYFLANNIISNRKIGFIHPDYKYAQFSKMIDKKMLKKLNGICTVSKETRRNLINVFPEFKNKIFAVQNLIDIDEINKLSKEKVFMLFNKKIFNIITVCRLDNTSKALDRLLKICLMLKKDGFKFIWRIIGEGPYEKEMRNFIKINELETNIILLGYKKNPIPYVKKSDLFVLQSYYEGFPISVCEAIIVDTPCLITNFTAAHELIDNEINGFIVNNDINAIYNKLYSILLNRNCLNTIKSNLKKYYKYKFIDTSAFVNVCKNN